VEVQDGVVRFLGNVTDEVREAARKIARRTRGVIGFAEEAVAPPFPPLRIGEPVFARDGRYGTLHKVVIDPYVRRVTHLVVRKGWLLSEDRVIPIERVETIELDGIYLDETSAKLDRYPRYREETFVEPLAGWEAMEPYAAADTLFWGAPFVGVAPPVVPVIEHVVPVGIPEEEVVLRRSADVIHHGQLIGSLDHLLVDPTNGAVTYFVVKDDKTGRRGVVPVSWLREFIDGAIVLGRWEPDQPGVPAYEGEGK
jgi:sporulation protein YlmC with PRC-barrel domain